LGEGIKTLLMESKKKEGEQTEKLKKKKFGDKGAKVRHP